MSIYATLRGLVVREDLKSPADLKTYRMLFVHLLALFAIVALPLSMLITIPVYFAEGRYSHILLTFIFLGVVIAQICYKKASYLFRAIFWLVIINTCSFFFLVTMGPDHARPAWLVMCTVMAGLTFGLRAAAVSTVINAVELCLCYLLIGPENAVWASEHSLPLMKKIMFVVNLSLLSIISSFSVGFLLNRLGRSLALETAARQNLDREKAKLLQSQGKLEAEVQERTRAEAALRKSQQRFAALYNSKINLVFIVDLNDNFLDANEAALDLFGYSRDDFGSLKFSNLIHPEQPVEPIIAVVQEIIETGTQQEPLHLKLQAKTGEAIYVITGGSLLPGSEEIVGVARDMTESVKSGEEKRLLENRLVQSQKMEAIGTLAGGIAHDFNNILTAIIGYTELSVADAHKDSLQYSNLRKILKAGKRARDLVKQILTFSRQSDHEMIVTKVQPIWKEAFSLLRASLPATIEICENIQSDGAILADPTQIHQVIMNLGTNAAQAMQEQSGMIEIGLHEVLVDDALQRENPDLKAGRYLKLTVTDDGKGMEPAVVERIFDPFFTTKERGRGTGMGLAVVHGIVKSHHGAITVESEIGRGTCFEIYLPLAGDVVSEPELQSPTTLPGGNETILLVDDEEFQVDLGRQLLERLGYTVITAHNGLEALEIFKAEHDRFDLVITDLVMPRLTGDKMAQELMTIRPEIPVLLLTGYSDNVTKERGAEMGLRGFAYKPLVIKELAEIIRKVLDDR